MKCFDWLRLIVTAMLVADKNKHEIRHYWNCRDIVCKSISYLMLTVA